MGGKGRIFCWRALMLGLALLAVLSFSVGKVAECAGDVGAGSQGAAGAADEAAGQTHSESADSESAEIGPARTGPEVQRCHHDAGHKHKGAASKLYASPRRVVDQVGVTPVGPIATDSWSVSALVLLGILRRGPPSPVSRSFPSGRQTLILGCVART